MRVTMRALLLGLVLAGCASQPPKAAVNRDTLTKRQADSIIGASGLPGAKAIPKAQGSADAVERHNAAIDSANAAIDSANAAMQSTSQ